MSSTTAFALLVVLTVFMLPGNSANGAEQEISDRFYWDRSLQRTGQRETVHLWVERPLEHESWVVTAELHVPEGVQLHGPARQESDEWIQPRVITTTGPHRDEGRFVEGPILYCAFAWEVEADRPVEEPLTATYTLADGSTATTALATDFRPPLDVGPQEYVPEPEPATTDFHVGGIYFPGWKPGVHWGWSILDAYPERKPALGYYDESIPEVMDWQIKWAVEHGMTFFMFCWYRERGNQGEPVQLRLEHALHDGFFNARYASMIDFAIMWENQVGRGPGITDLDDLMTNLFAFWMENYFTHPSYLVIDNKPVLFIYDVHNIIRDLGSEEAVKEATDAMRDAAMEEGFDGLHLIAEYRGDDPSVLDRFKACGIDYSFAYCFHTVSPEASQEEAVETLRSTHQGRFERRDVLPDVPTIAVGWRPEPWETYAGYSASPHWWLEPAGYKHQAQNLRAMMESQPEDCLSSRMVMLDNLNEWGEGHYILPHREFGFDYLEAIRATFTDAPVPHRNILPEDIGLGPYDEGHWAWVEEMKSRLSEQAD